MKLNLRIGNHDVRFSNLSEGFDIFIEHVSLPLRGWGTLVPFISAVLDYSWDNGLVDVKDPDLETLKNSLKDALRHVNEEMDSRLNK